MIKKIALAIAVLVAAPAAGAVDVHQMRAEMLAPVVKVEAGKGTGSGTVIFPRGAAAARRDVCLDGGACRLPTPSDTAPINVDVYTYNRAGIFIGVTKKPALLITLDDDVDLAVVKLVDDVNVLPSATLPARDLDVGVFDPVVAVGAGLGNPPFPTEGVISNTDVELQGHRYFQESASIIYGNSGGALFRFNPDTKHYELIGVPARVAAYAQGAPATEMGFAIPFTAVLDFISGPKFSFIFDK